MTTEELLKKVEELQKKVDFYKNDRDGWAERHLSMVARNNAIRNVLEEKKDEIRVLRLHIFNLQGQNRALRKIAG